MKYNKLLVKLAIIIIVLANVAIPAILNVPVMANGRYGEQCLSIHPNHGPVGTEVCLSGSSFTPSVLTDNFTPLAKLYFPNETTLVKETHIDTQGNFETCFVVSQCPAGEHMVWVYDELASPSSWDSRWTTTKFRVEPKIELSKSPSYVGDNITISGTGFATTSDTIIYFNDSEVAAAITDENGSFTETGIIIPESDNGRHNVKAVDASNNQSICEFITKQQVTISPTSGPIGEEVTISGSGFAADKPITITFDDYIVVTSPSLVKTNHTGNFTGKFSVPACIANIYTVEASDGSNKAGAAFVAVPSGKINRIIGYVGSDVTFSGTGFIPDRIVIIYYDTIPVAEATAGASGSFSANFKIPTSSSGEHTISATDGTNATKCTFTLFTTTFVPSGKVNRIIGYVGSGVAFSGTGFIPDRIVMIYYDTILVAEATAGASGNFSANFKIPASSGGEHTVSATDGTNTTECIFTMESIAPPTPAPLLPANASNVKPKIHFVWDSVTDPSGVTYTLQIAPDASFNPDNSTSLVLERSKLTTTEYTLIPEEKLEQIKKGVPYYWRVRAIDNASNIGSWSTVQEFYVDISSPPMPPWVLYSLIVEGGIFVCFLGYYWLVRRRV